MIKLKNKSIIAYNDSLKIEQTPDLNRPLDSDGLKKYNLLLKNNEVKIIEINLKIEQAKKRPNDTIKRGSKIIDHC